MSTKIPNFFFYDLDGNLVELTKIADENNSLLICYFIKDCEGCHEQLEIISKLAVQENWDKSIVLMSNSNPFELRELQNAFQLKMPILYDHWGQYGIHLNINDYPFSIVIDRELVITHLFPKILLEEEIKEVVKSK